MNKLMSNLKLSMCLDNATLEKMHEIRIKVFLTSDRNFTKIQKNFYFQSVSEFFVF